MPAPGRDDARERIKKAAPSHGAQSHQTEAERNKKENADLKKTQVHRTPSKKREA